MRELLATGLSAAEAARQAGSEPPALAEVAPAAAAAAELRRALEQLDDAAAHAAFDRLLADYSLESRARRRRPAAPARARRRAGSGARSPSRRSTSPRTCSAVACSALRAAGTAARAARGARVSAGRAARSGARDLRARTPGARLADHVPRRRHAARHDRRDRASGSSRRRSSSPSRTPHGSRRWQTTVASPPRHRHDRLGRRRGSAGSSTVRSFSRASALEAAEQVSR